MKKLLIAFLLLPMSLAVYAETAVEKGLAIAKAADAYDAGFGDFTADMEMILTNRKGDQSIRKIRAKTLEVAGAGDKTMSIFDEPRDVRGTAMLTFSHGLKPDDQWLYLPALNRVKRISSKNKSGPFMGSEFAFEDLGSQEVEKFTYLYLGSEKCGENWDCNVVERRPAYKHSGYTRQIVRGDKETFKIDTIEFYDRKDSLLKTLTFKDYEQFLSQHWRPSEMFMENHQTGKTTLLKWTNYQFQTGLSESDFRKNKLQSLR